jgi:hypothetical protein
MKTNILFKFLLTYKRFNMDRMKEVFNDQLIVAEIFKNLTKKNVRLDKVIYSL